jgi:hypothetical protein
MHQVMRVEDEVNAAALGGFGRERLRRRSFLVVVFSG